MSSLRIGIALGSGSARGWAHIGVMHALQELGIEPDVIAGSSIGAVVGAACASGHLDELEAWIGTLDRMDVIRLLDARLTGGGFIRGDRLMANLRKRVEDVPMGALPRRFGAVATELNTGREIWLREGSLIDAVRASIALPGLFTPAPWNGGWLLDGGLVNPVPISLCRAMGADVVIAVNLNGDLVSLQRSRQARIQPEDQAAEQDAGALADADPSVLQRLMDSLHLSRSVRLEALMSSLRGADDDKEPQAPGLFDVLAGSINIIQDRLTRSRMAGDPPDIMISPRLSHIHLMDFHRAREAIQGGYDAVAPHARELKMLRES
ncbi:MAG: patatin-like phospholipase RssA [Gammaproteobacteria bacterium]|jgi:NTE family protein